MVVGLGIVGIIGYCTYDIQNNTDGALAKMYKGSPLQQAMDWVHSNTVGRVEDIFEPQDGLIPDWPDAPCYGGNIPPGTPPPPLLVVDLERTLIGTIHDYNMGYRHVKRPGLTKFINALSNYYEIVIFSENDAGTVQEILEHIDPEGKCHKLGSAAAEIRGVSVLKRLDRMNRPLSKVILIDDSAESSSLFPRNTLLVKPFTDVRDKTDTTLLDLIPLLQALVHDDVRDFRDTFDRLGTHEAEEACIEYRMRLSERKRAEQDRRNRGLGGLIRGPAREELDDSEIRSLIPSAAQIVGAAPSGSDKFAAAVSTRDAGKVSAVEGIQTPFGTVGEKKKGPAVKKKGALFSMIEQAEEANASVDEIKKMKMNEIHQKREMEKAAARQKKEEEAAARRRAQME